jgi:hypothetical protein
MRKYFMAMSSSRKGQPVKNSPCKNKIVIGLKITPCICFGILLLGLAGCCIPRSALESDYGNAWAYNQDVQIADPKAGLVQTPATGLNPQASVNVMGAYNKSFSGSQSGGGSSTTINLGGLTTAGGGGGK